MLLMKLRVGLIILWTKGWLPTPQEVIDEVIASHTSTSGRNWVVQALGKLQQLRSLFVELSCGARGGTTLATLRNLAALDLAAHGLWGVHEQFTISLNT